VRAADRARAQRQGDLAALQRAMHCDIMGTLGIVHRQIGGRRPCGQITEVTFGQGCGLVLGDVADDGQAGVGRRVALPVEVHQLGAREALQIGVVTQGALQRIPEELGVDGQLQVLREAQAAQDAHQLRIAQRPLAGDGLALLGELVFREGRVEDHLRQPLQRQGQAALRDLHRVAGSVVAGPAVGLAALVAQARMQLCLGPTLGAAEKHVLDEVRQAGLAARGMARAGANYQLGCDGGVVRAGFAPDA